VLFRSCSSEHSNWIEGDNLCTWDWSTKTCSLRDPKVNIEYNFIAALVIIGVCIIPLNLIKWFFEYVYSKEVVFSKEAQESYHGEGKAAGNSGDRNIAMHEVYEHQAADTLNWESISWVDTVPISRIAQPEDPINERSLPGSSSRHLSQRSYETLAISYGDQLYELQPAAKSVIARKSYKEQQQSRNNSPSSLSLRADDLSQIESQTSHTARVEVSSDQSPNHVSFEHQLTDTLDQPQRQVIVAPADDESSHSDNASGRNAYQDQQYSHQPARKNSDSSSSGVGPDGKYRKRKMSRVVNDLTSHATVDDHLKHTVVIHHFVEELMNPLERFLLQGHFFHLDHAEPETLGWLLWAFSLLLTACLWVFFIAYTYMWLLQNDSEVVRAWGVTLVIAWCVEVFLIEIVGVYLRHILPIACVRSKLRSVYETLAVLAHSSEVSGAGAGQSPDNSLVESSSLAARAQEIYQGVYKEMLANTKRPSSLSPGQSGSSPVRVLPDLPLPQSLPQKSPESDLSMSPSNFVGSNLYDEDIPESPKSSSPMSLRFPNYFKRDSPEQNKTPSPTSLEAGYGINSNEGFNMHSDIDAENASQGSSSSDIVVDSNMSNMFGL